MTIHIKCPFDLLLHVYSFFSDSMSATKILDQCCNGYTGLTISTGNQMFFRFTNNGDGDAVYFTIRYFGFDPSELFYPSHFSNSSVICNVWSVFRIFYIVRQISPRCLFSTGTIVVFQYSQMIWNVFN